MVVADLEHSDDSRSQLNIASEKSDCFLRVVHVAAFPKHLMVALILRIQPLPNSIVFLPSADFLADEGDHAVSIPVFRTVVMPHFPWRGQVSVWRL